MLWYGSDSHKACTLGPVDLQHVERVIVRACQQRCLLLDPVELERDN